MLLLLCNFFPSFFIFPLSPILCKWGGKYVKGLKRFIVICLTDIIMITRQMSSSTVLKHLNSRQLLEIRILVVTVHIKHFFFSCLNLNARENNNIERHWRCRLCYWKVISTILLWLLWTNGSFQKKENFSPAQVMLG